MKKKLLIFVLLVVAVLIGGYFYAYKGHRDIASEAADFEITVNDLSQAFSENDSLANAKYADKTIQIYGKITQIDLSSSTIVVDEKLSAVFADSILPQIKVKDEVTIKGRFVGYDDLLEEFKVDQVTLVK